METKLTDSSVHYDPHTPRRLSKRKINARWALITAVLFAALIVALLIAGVPFAWHWGG